MGRTKTPLARQLADIDLRLLRIFKTVVDSGGFSAAQNTLNITTSTISNYMSDLEERLDLRLCNRGRGGFSLTEHGKIVYDATEELIDALESFRSRVNSAHETLLGDLHLAVPEQSLMIPGNGLVDALTEFSELAPDVRIQLSTMNTEDIVPAVLNGSAQMGIGVMHQPNPNLICQPLYVENMSLYCGQNHPLFGAGYSEQSLAELNQSRFVESLIMRSGFGVSPVVDSWQKQATAMDEESRLALILTGNYVGYLGDHVAEREPWKNNLYRLFPNDFGYQNIYQLIYKSQLHRNHIVTTFAGLMNKYCTVTE